MNLTECFESALSVEAKRRLRRIGELADEAHLVGGPLRDLLMNRPVGDFDVVVEDGIRVARAFASDAGWTLAKTHESFGTATVLAPDGTRYDFVTARRERYPSPGALPLVERGSLDDDLRRRDFSINALAMRLSPDRFGEVRDVVGGLDDLRRGIVRALHPASFVDDPTRIFRAYRFAERFRFSLDPDTTAWMGEAVGYLSRLSGARVAHELLALVREAARRAIVQRLRAVGALDALAEPCPCDDATLDAWRNLEERLPLPTPSRMPFLLAWFGRWPLEKALRVAGWLNLGAPTTRALRLLAERREPLRRALADPETPGSVWHRLLADLSEDERLALGAECDANDFALLQRRSAEVCDVRPLVTGEDLLRMGIEPGPRLRQILAATFDAQLDGTVRTRKDALAYAKALDS